VRLLIYFTLLICTAIVSAEPAQKSAELDQAREHINAMEYTQAAESINLHLTKHANDIRALHLLAKTYAWDNNYQMSEQTYSKLLKIEANNPEYLFGKGNALVWLQKSEQAIPLLEQAWNVKKNNANYLKILILTLNQTAADKNIKHASELSALGQKQFPNQLWD